ARAGRGTAAGAAPRGGGVYRGTPPRLPEPGADGDGRRPQPLPLRAAVQGGHRTAAAPVRPHPPRRAGQAAPANRKPLLPRGRCHPPPFAGTDRVLQPLNPNGGPPPGALRIATKTP